jgi:hypothetical protein
MRLSSLGMTAQEEERPGRTDRISATSLGSITPSSWRRYVLIRWCASVHREQVTENIPHNNSEYGMVLQSGERFYSY